MRDLFRPMISGAFVAGDPLILVTLLTDEEEESDELHLRVETKLLR